MAVRGFFYNSNKDRYYNGQDMNEDKAPFYKEGVCFGQLGVTADGTDMNISIDGGPRTGYGYLNLHTIHNTTVLKLPVTQADGTYPRIDCVIMQNDETKRASDIFIREGAYSSAPAPPVLVNNDTIQEKCLAQILVPAGAIKITQANITDTRADSGLCGYIASQFVDVDFEHFALQFKTWYEEFKTGHVADFEGWAQEQKDIVLAVMTELQEDAETLKTDYAAEMQQYESDQQKNFDTWFNGIRDQLSEDAAGNLQNNKVNIVVAESDIPIDLRAPKTFYFMITDRTQLYDGNITVSPNMGIVVK